MPTYTKSYIREHPGEVLAAYREGKSVPEAQAKLAAQYMGQIGGSTGGKARAAAMTPEELSQAAGYASRIGWKKRRRPPDPDGPRCVKCRKYEQSAARGMCWGCYARIRREERRSEATPPKRRRRPKAKAIA